MTRFNSPLAAIISMAFVVAGSVRADQPSAIGYNRDVRPILADNCFRCHGVDEATREADLRLDDRDSAVMERDGSRAIAPGQPDRSSLLRRVLSSDDDERMPPHDDGERLKPAEVETLRRWIAAGAKYEVHWAFVPPRRPAPPHVKNRRWPKNPIDQFVLARLEAAGLRPNGRADPAALIRRASLHVNGLPPTIGEVDAFQRADSDEVRGTEAYARLIDRLLASPRFGEHLARSWLDAARYADTNGYFTDNDRTMWPWRDWVIDALNQNMPFDRFTVEQLTGDLLPGATLQQRIATGFNRNHMVNNETGIIEEEFRVEYVIDRVDTTATVWLGLTMGCARCHDHKYDPISRREFYQFFAFFNNVPERGLSGSSGNAAPFLQTPAPEQQALLKQLAQDISSAKRDFATIDKELDIAQTAWEANAVDGLPAAPSNGLVAHQNLDALSGLEIRGGQVTTTTGLLKNAAKFGGDAAIQVSTDVNFERDDSFSFGAWINPQGSGCVISKMDDVNDMRGFDLILRKNKAIVNVVHRWNRDALRVATVSTVARKWQHIMVTYDGSSRADGVSIYIDGRRRAVDTDLDRLTGSIRNEQPVRIGRRKSSASYTGLVDDVRIYNRVLNEDEVAQLASRQLVEGIVARPREQRSDQQKKMLRDWFVDNLANRVQREAIAKLQRLEQRRRDALSRIPTSMVMREQAEPRRTHMLTRGQYDQPGEPVVAGFPQFFSPPPGKPSIATQAPLNRLDLANWILRPDHPLTARVAANRLWQHVFGHGVVATVDDVGTQGAMPSHPELLDWLAVELVEHDWDIKHLLRLMLTSATFQQSAQCTDQRRTADRNNRLLSRGPSRRLSAEAVRDNALAVSGLLVERTGGPSVMPYQPAGLWKDVTYDSNRGYDREGGASLYRRSLYTFWKRQAPPPNMLVFDAPTRETCAVERSQTNTPLQALVLMNDPTFVEAARKLAARALRTGGLKAEQRAAFAFRAATSRRPDEEELSILLSAFQEQQRAFAADSADAKRLLQVGESPIDSSLDVIDLASWTIVASMILSLDETISSP